MMRVMQCTTPSFHKKSQELGLKYTWLSSHYRHHHMCHLSDLAEIPSVAQNFNLNILQNNG